MYNLYLGEYSRTVVKKWNERNNSSYQISIDKKSIEALNPDPAKVAAELRKDFEKGLIARSEYRSAIGRPEELPDENLTVRDRFMQMSPSMASAIYNSLTEEEKQTLLSELGIID